MSRISQREMLERDRLSEANGDELGKLWIADRILRVASYQDMAVRIEQQISELRDVDDTPNPYSEGAQASFWEDFERNRPKRQRVPAMLIREYVGLLRTAAEELGQLPNDLPPNTEGAVYAVVGVSQEDLRKLR